MGTGHLGIPVVSSFYLLIKSWLCKQWSRENNLNVIAPIWIFKLITIYKVKSSQVSQFYAQLMQGYYFMNHVHHVHHHLNY